MINSTNKNFVKHIPLYLIVLAIMLVNLNCYAQKQQRFTGMLEYKITVHDTSLRSLFPDNIMIIYTNDTITRIENFTNQLGKQVVLRHMEKKKSYLLLDTDKGKFAIRTDESKADTIKAERQFTFKKKMFKRSIVNRKANRMMVSHPEFEEPIEFLYFKKISNKYSTFYKELPGLPVKFSVPTADGIVDYELVKMSEYSPNYDLFGVPSDFQLVTFDEFLEKMVGENSDIE